MLRFVVKGDGDPFEPPQLRITSSIVIIIAPSYYSLVTMVISLVGGKEVGHGRKGRGLGLRKGPASRAPGGPEEGRQSSHPSGWPSEPCLGAPASLNPDLSTRALTCPLTSNRLEFILNEYLTDITTC